MLDYCAGGGGNVAGDDAASHGLDTGYSASDARIVETGPAPTVLGEPAHPYTQLLLRAVPKIGVPLPEETGVPSEPTSRRPQSGCAFAPRCPLADDTCRAAAPILKPSPRDPNHLTACFKA